MRLTKTIKRTVLNFILLTAAFLLQTSVFPFLPFLTAVPNLLLILVFSFGFIYGSFTGMLCGLYAGFLMDMFCDVPYGFYVLIFVYIGFINGLFTNYYYDDYLTLPVMLCVISELFYCGLLMLLRYLTTGAVNVGWSLLHIVLPEVFFSVTVTLLLYRAFLRTNRTLDLKEDKRGQNVA